jgi:hypothetical protein
MMMMMNKLTFALSMILLILSFTLGAVKGAGARYGAEHMPKKSLLDHYGFVVTSDASYTFPGFRMKTQQRSDLEAK